MNQVLKDLMIAEFGTADIFALSLREMPSDLSLAGIDFRGGEDDAYLSRKKVITPMDLRLAVSKLSVHSLP